MVLRPAARRERRGAAVDRFDDRNETITYGKTTGLNAASMVPTTRPSTYDSVEKAFDEATKAKLSAPRSLAFRLHAIVVTGEPRWCYDTVYTVTDNGATHSGSDLPSALSG